MTTVRYEGGPLDGQETEMWIGHHRWIEHQQDGVYHLYVRVEHDVSREMEVLSGISIFR